MITVVLLNYKRQQNMDAILTSLVEQTVRPEIFVWNNSTEPFHDHRIDKYVHSPSNLQCWPRWFMAQYASNDFVVMLDDDIRFTTNDCLELLLKEAEMHYEPGRAFGPYGVQLNGSGDYFPTKSQKRLKRWGISLQTNVHIDFPEKSEKADIIKGRCFMINKNDLVRMPLMAKYNDFAEDIIASHFLANGKPRHHLVTHVLNGKMEDLWGKTGEMAASEMTNWRDFRSKALKNYFYPET